MKDSSIYGILIIQSITWIAIGGVVRNKLGTNANFGFSANFHFQYKFCRFVCLKKCSSGESTKPEEKPAPEPDDYYWREYYGVIPPDAFKIGSSDQKPQTYVGLVFDPERNGTFVTTIFDGTNYVYNVVKGKKSKLTEHIQILCTMKPERLIWMVLNPEILKNLKDRKNVQGHFHIGYNEKTGLEYFYHYIVKDSSKPFVGAVNKFGATMEYAKLDGTISSSDQLLWLMFITKEPEGKSAEKLCSYTYDFSFKIGSYRITIIY
ncbi:uncharacterized protein LOC123309510 [Coccinella septempunctata]|uniref:uncharacterized protein LOC123309510 n=1 Tax=Coccinella septempunctata TaxID=41139 RepID=UPI001D068FF3|nr:uncharacterized protein LOC123309510 [Coccinella septempunctata]